MFKALSRSFVIFMFLFATTPAAASDILRAQNLLIELGYDPGTPDGIWGSKTKKAMEQYSLDRGLSFDGVIDYDEIENLTYSLTQQQSRKFDLLNITHGMILPEKPNNFDYLNSCSFKQKLHQTLIHLSFYLEKKCLIVDHMKLPTKMKLKMH